ncbi:MAG: hypothetical protein AAFR41_02535 [Pseudomonadota bacterium]
MGNRRNVGRKVSSPARYGAAAFAMLAFSPCVCIAELMTREEIEDELMGVKVSGVIEGTSVRWRECIDREGQTVYEVDGDQAREGTVTITEAGLACFSYGGLASCFTVERDGPYYAFVDAMDRFLVKQVERPIRECTGPRGAGEIG